MCCDHGAKHPSLLSVITQEPILRLLAFASQIVLAKEFIPILSIPGCWLLLTKKNGQVDLEILNCHYLLHGLSQSISWLQAHLVKED